MAVFEIGSAVTIQRGEGIPAVVVEVMPHQIRCQLEDRRAVWVPTEQLLHRRGGPEIPPTSVRPSRTPAVYANTVAVAGSISTNPYAAPRVSVAPLAEADFPGARNSLQDWRWLFFSLQGRASRKQYWLGHLIAGGFWLLLLIAAGMALGALSAGAGEKPGAAMTVGPLAIIFLGYGGALWSSLAMGVKRWHDRNRSGWFSLLGMIPVINFWALLETGFLRGTPGPNRFGGDPTL